VIETAVLDINGIHGRTMLRQQRSCEQLPIHHRPRAEPAALSPGRRHRLLQTLMDAVTILDRASTSASSFTEP
jgi:hypothetical protein